LARGNYASQRSHPSAVQTFCAIHITSFNHGIEKGFIMFQLLFSKRNRTSLVEAPVSKKTLGKVISKFKFLAFVFLICGFTQPVFALQDWTVVPAGCAGTDNNFYSGVPSAAFPVPRFIVPGGRLSFNALHTGYIAIVCNVDNPRDLGTNPAWDQLEVTYVDPDGVHTVDVHTGDAYQVLARLIRVNKVTGIQSVVTEFDSNNDCPLGSFCDGTTVRTMIKPFAHAFDFANYAYAVYGRLYRRDARLTVKPILIQMRLNNR
jgi:hypothetical protein